MYRQGDLLFIQYAGVPKGDKKMGLDILSSSLTGHSHSLTAGAVYVVPFNSDRWDRERASFFIEVPAKGAKVVHPEHKAIPLKEGVYEVIRQREVNGFVQD